MSLSFPGKRNHVIKIGLPQTIDRDECLVPHAHPITYSKFIQYVEIPVACGWEDDNLVRKTTPKL